MPNKRKQGTKLYTVAIDEELGKKVMKMLEIEKERLGPGYNPTRSDVIRKVLEENCDKYLNRNKPKGEGSK